MTTDNKILIVEDDPKIIELVRIHLGDIGMHVDHAMDGLIGLEKATNNDYSLIILDLMLPHMDGLEVCRRIKSKDKFTPILMLTAKSEELDKVLGLEVGADDYLTKPFGIRELVARVKAILRRVELDQESSAKKDDSEKLEFRDLVIDLEKHMVLLEGERVELTAKEFDMLTLFASHPGNTYSRERLLDLVWGYQYEGYEHTVSSHINRLRNKIEKDPTNPQYIKTLWGVGYRFEAPEG
ncbi:MAG: DNA-binding response regulator [Calditrichaeota bacterium]|nr:MAG: DNA-binding response regulator [Calditrichota bacterium]MBL1206793.1 DNA-binding response regulator [Calditrichota bacterium]NOG46621.1 response regulator transcription factor [Calditrichota bacterium]